MLCSYSDSLNLMLFGHSELNQQRFRNSKVYLNFSAFNETFSLQINSNSKALFNRYLEFLIHNLNVSYLVEKCHVFNTVARRVIQVDILRKSLR